MGESTDPEDLPEEERQADRKQRAFTKALLDDLRALERMLDKGMFETGKRRVGAEQEMFLVDAHMNPALASVEALAATEDPRLVCELARFNLEGNARPQLFHSGCLRAMEEELTSIVAEARAAAAKVGAKVLLTGILPTIQKSDLGLESMTPNDRYYALNTALLQMREGEPFRVDIQGIDELHAIHDSVMLEACNTSFQVHFQVEPREFARLYNVAQAVTAPVLAVAANSPVFLGKRLWAETRVALFDNAIDSRSSTHMARGLASRVSFGERWVKESVLEIFRDQVARFRVVLPADRDEDPNAVLDEGRVPQLNALRLHNGTVYRWNRACYGINEGVPHLRIENRALPAGPTIIDEVANAAFFFGLMSAVLEEYGDISKVMPFDHAKDNFFAAARHGLKAQFTWVKGKTHSASDLILQTLLPLAREGLLVSKIDRADIDRYLGVIEERTLAKRTGATWALKSLETMGDKGTANVRARRLVESMIAYQIEGNPVHTWALSGVGDPHLWRQSYLRVEQFMTTNLLTVHPGDPVDLAASMMDWERIRHVPVEDNQGRLLGLLTHRDLLRLVARGGVPQGDSATAPGETVPVERIMKTKLVTVAPDTPTLRAMHLMRERRVDCLPVVDDGKLVGLITQSDLLAVSSHLLERFLAQEE